jgi:membrane protease YdiL (CAAX protease family)
MSAAMPGLPGQPAGHPAPPLERPELPDGVEPTPVTPRWKAWTAWVALVGGFAGAIAGALVIGIVAAAFGASLTTPPPAVNILATIAQDLCLVAAAILMARVAATPRPWDFGLRPTPFWPAVGWVAVLLVSFVVFTAAWVALLGAKNTDETLPKELGADQSTVALLAVALLVCVVAPFAEEFFFRGYFFTAMRSWRGMWPAAIITGAVFGAIHAGSADPAFLVPLGALGTGLCLLYVRTGSLYPCVAAHALNNSIAFGASQHWGWQIIPLVAVSLSLLAAVFLIVRRAGGAPPPVAALRRAAS